MTTLRDFQNPRKPLRARRRSSRAFSLLEVMIAVAIFFMAIFSILQLVSTNLRNARRLGAVRVDGSSLAAELTLTNILEEGTTSGDFGDLYPGYSWTRDVKLVGTNGLFQVDCTVLWTEEKKPLESKLSILLFRPDSPSRAPMGLP